MSMPMNACAIIDDAIPSWQQDFVELLLLGKSTDKKINTGMMPFYCKYESTAEEGGNVPLSFTHVLKSNDSSSDYLNQLAFLPKTACDYQNIIMHQIIQARAFVVVPHKTDLDHYAPHTDIPEDHTVCIYYVNDADGDTVFFDDDLNIIKRVSPKKGRLILFNGKIMHGGGIPKDGPRCIINFDLATR